MSAIPHSRPANDLHPRASQQIPWVALPRPYWNKNRMAAAIVAGVVALIGGAVVAYAPRPQAPVPPVVVAVPAPPPVKNDDITLNTPPPEAKTQPDVAVFDGKTPNDILPQILDVNVEDGATGAALEQAARQAMPMPAPPVGANSEKNLHIQYRAAQLDPDNMMRRLRLAVSYDRAGKNAGALELYRQVIDAYDRQDTSLPPSLDIDSVRRRAAYLATIKD